MWNWGNNSWWWLLRLYIIAALLIFGFARCGFGRSVALAVHFDHFGSLILVLLVKIRLVWIHCFALPPT